MPDDAFSRDLSQLSPRQIEAVDWQNGPALVIAGPGSGKTRVLTCRLAKVVRENPDSRQRVLGLTFTNKAAGEMRSRLAAYVPDSAGRVEIETFHSFSARILRSHARLVGLRPDFKILSPSDRRDVYREAVVEGRLGMGSNWDTSKELNAISELRARLVLPESTSQVLGKGTHSARVENCYRVYEDALVARNAVDFDSLTYFTYRILQSDLSITNHYRRVYPHIAVDEFQDTDYAQYALLGYLGSTAPRNVFAVADDDQLIFEWRGASATRLYQFRVDYHPHEVELDINYRSPKEIIIIADRLIRANRGRADGRPIQESARPPSPVSPIRTLPVRLDPEAEAEAIAMDIKSRALPNEESVAVIVPRNALVESIARRLAASGVPCFALIRRDDFQSAPLELLLATLEWAIDQADERRFKRFLAALARVTGSTSSIGDQFKPKRVLAILDWVAETLAGPGDGIERDFALAIRDARLGTESFLPFCRSAVKLFNGARIQEALKALGELTSYALERDVWSRVVHNIVQTYGRETELAAFLQEIQLQSKEPTPEPGVTLAMTIHTAKGREFDHVYIAGLAEGILPYLDGATDGGEAAKLEEARRSCYVAVTRALRSLTFSRAESYEGSICPPSRFLSEMDLRLLIDPKPSSMADEGG